MASTEGAAASGDSGSVAGSAQESARSISKSKYDIANHLTDNELREFKEIFSLVDTVRFAQSLAAKFRAPSNSQDGGGTISATELSDLMETLGIRASDVCVHCPSHALRLGACKEPFAGRDRSHDRRN